MTRDELIELASPPCHECGNPVKRVEVRHKRVGVTWVVSGMLMVCEHGHRIPVEPADA